MQEELFSLDISAAFLKGMTFSDIAKETGDRTGQATAQQNLTELGKVGCHDQCHLDIDMIVHYVHRSFLF